MDMHKRISNVNSFINMHRMSIVLPPPNNSTSIKQFDTGNSNNNHNMSLDYNEKKYNSNHRSPSQQESNIKQLASSLNKSNYSANSNNYNNNNSTTTKDHHRHNNSNRNKLLDKKRNNYSNPKVKGGFCSYDKVISISSSKKKEKKSNNNYNNGSTITKMLKKIIENKKMTTQPDIPKKQTNLKTEPCPKENSYDMNYELPNNKPNKPNLSNTAILTTKINNQVNYLDFSKSYDINFLGNLNTPIQNNHHAAAAKNRTSQKNKQTLLVNPRDYKKGNLILNSDVSNRNISQYIRNRPTNDKKRANNSFNIFSSYDNTKKSDIGKYNKQKNYEIEQNKPNIKNNLTKLNFKIN